MVYLLVFEGDLLNGSTPDIHARQMLTSRLSETLPIPILDEWRESLWEAGQMENLIVGLETGGDGRLYCSVAVDRPFDRSDNDDLCSAGRLGAHPLEASHPAANSDWMDVVYDLRICGFSFDAVIPA